MKLIRISELGEVCLCIRSENQEACEHCPEASALTVKKLFPVSCYLKNILALAQEFWASIMPVDVLGKAELRILAFSFFLLA